MKNIRIISVLMLSMSCLFGQVDIKHPGIIKELVMADSITFSDTINVITMLKLTDKTLTDSVYILLGSGKDTANIDEYLFKVTQDGEDYFLTNTAFGSVSVDGRTAVFSKKYHKNAVENLNWATFYLKNTSATFSTRKYFRSYLPQ